MPTYKVHTMTISALQSVPFKFMQLVSGRELGFEPKHCEHYLQAQPQALFLDNYFK